MKKYGVQIQAWAPFAEGRNDLFGNETLIAVGKKYNKTSAQVTLRYLIQRDISVIPKTVSKDRMIQNFDVFDFDLAKEDMDVIAALDKAESLFFSHYDPETVERITGLVRKF
jgi:diketogulonate reductase-like aldo/keto reductase